MSDNQKNLIPLHGNNLRMVVVPQYFLVPEQELSKFQEYTKMIYKEWPYQQMKNFYDKQPSQNINVKEEEQQQIKVEYCRAPMQIPGQFDDFLKQVQSQETNRNGQILKIEEKENPDLDAKQIENEESDDEEKKRGKGKLWTRKETSLLQKYFVQYKGKWSQIVKHLEGRNISQCSQKFRKLNNDMVTLMINLFYNRNGRNRSGLPLKTKFYYRALRNTASRGFKSQNVKTGNIKNEIELPGRTCKQVRDRYVNKLDPKLNSGPWSSEEDQVIIQNFEMHGPKWTKIAEILQNRSENQVKNRFYYYIQPNHFGQQHNYLQIQKKHTDYQKPTQEMDITDK